MISIEYVDSLGRKTKELINAEFDKFAEKNDVTCDHKSFIFIAKEECRIIGVIKGHSYYNEVHIGELIILEEYRGQGIGRRLLEQAEKHFANSGFECITLTTYGFQAPEFYKKCGYEVEFVRENRKDPKLTKFFLIKFI